MSAARLSAVAFAFAAVLVSRTARAQGDEAFAPLASSVIASRAAAAERKLASGDAAGALAAYESLEDDLYDRGQFDEAGALGCRVGVVRLRAQRPLDEAVRAAVRALGGGLASAADDDARHECLASGARALVAAAQRRAGPERAPVALLEDLWFRAATWVRRARALGDSPALRAAHDAVPDPARAEVERLESPALDADDPESLGRAAERALYVADPTRIPDCIVDDDGTDGDIGALECFSTELPERGFGAEYPHVSIYYVQDGERFRTIGSAPRSSGFDCETGVVRETERFVRLTMSRDGIDGTLRTFTDGGDDGAGTVELERHAHVCDAARGACRSIPLGRRSCRPDTQGRAVCSASWEATVRSRRGVLTVRATRGRLPADVSARIELAALFAGPPNAPRSRDLGATTTESARCHAEVADPRPPLNVRAAPDQASAVAGTLPNGTEVRPRERRRGWVRIDRPVAGWIFARNLRRVCR